MDPDLFDSKISAFVIGAANMIAMTGVPHNIAVVIMGVFVASFAGTTLDTATRIQRYVIGEFEGLGTHLLILLPGRSETTGGPPPLLGETPLDPGDGTASRPMSVAVAPNGDGPVMRVDPIACEGCGVCAWFCSEGAIDLVNTVDGEWYLSETRLGPMVHARLGVAAENSGKLVALVRQEAKKLAEEKHLGLILTDGPPGIGCPVIASIGGATAVLIVTEPTISGLHDMGRAIELAEHFKVPAMVCVNKFYLDSEMDGKVRDACAELQVPVS